VERDMTAPLEKDPVSTQELDYLSLIGEEPQRWLQELHSEEITRLRDSVGQALSFLWRRDLEGGFRLLAEIEAAVPRVALESPSMAHLVARHCFAARAYAHYLAGDLDAAKLDLQRAHAEMTSLLNLCSFLVPMAAHFIDFLTQRARIARRENRWQEAKRCIETIRRIYANETPYCVLDSGKEIRHEDIRVFFESLDLNASQRARAAALLGDNAPLDERMEFIEEVIFALPDLVIPYP
jgi:hypothetical protein